MPKKEQSLLSSKIAQIAKNRRIPGSEFDLIVKPNSASARITIAVSKKVAKRAVDRNRIKRIIREALRKNDTLKEPAVFILKKNIASLKSYQVEQLIKEVLSRS